jgi:predicted aldo/keto reductase-like oxidoreductase
MSQHEDINRREFLQKSVLTAGTVVLAGGVVGAAIHSAHAETPAPPAAPPQPPAEMPKVKHRRLGRTKLEIAEIAAPGDSLRDPVMFSIAVNAGLNYFHKAEGTFSNPRNQEVLLKDRERFYLDVVIDSLDEQRAYDEFESKRKATGSEYVDFFKVHSTWKTVEDFQTQRGVLMAYERLKKEKKVRWLALSKHNPNTNEVLTAALESDMFDAIQPAVSQIGEFQKLLALAKKKDCGVICMKTGAGGIGKKPEFAKFGDPDKPFRTYYRYLLSLDGVTAIVSNFKNFDQMRENLSASGAPMQKSEVEAITLALLNAPRNYRDCITCGECRGACPGELAVDDIMRYRMYAEDYGDYHIARQHYADLPAEWKAIVASGKGIPADACPYGLSVAAELKQAHRWLA